MGAFFDGLISWSIHNRVVVLLGAAALVAAGVWSAMHASLDVLPDFTPPFVVVQTEATGMATLDVEQLVTRPLEQVLLGTPQTTAVRSTSTPGLSVVSLFFDERVDAYRARQLVTERLQLAQTRLPQTIGAPQLMPIVAPIGALLRVCLTSNDPNQDQALRDLRTFADWTMRPRLLAVPGVAQVMSLGGFVERVEVRPDPTRLRQRGVLIVDLVNAVRSSQSLTGAGFTETASARLDVQNDARLRLEDAVGTLTNTAIPSTSATASASAWSEGRSRIVATRTASRRPARVTIGDVADVVPGVEPPVGAALYDGRPAVFVQVNKLPGADTVAVTRQVEHAIEDLKGYLPSGSRIEPPVFRQATFVETSVRSVGRAMLIGSILVILILVSFLRYGRLAVISLTAIPLSILTAGAVLIAFGASINGMTLGGLAIAVGEVVDDAIVDVENVWRRLRENTTRRDPLPALDVVRAASREIRGSVVYATVIVAIVLIPVLLLGGIAGRIFAPLAHAYILAISASLLVALTVTPALCAWLLPPLATREPRLSRLSVWMLNRYRRLLIRVVDHPRLVFAVIGTLAALAIVGLPFIGGRFLPEFHETSLVGHLVAVPGISLAESTRLAAAVDGQLRAAGVASHTHANIGRADLSEDAAPVNSIELNVVLKNPTGEWDQITFETAKAMGRVPGLAFTVEAFLGERINEVLSGETAPVVIKVMGPDLQRLRALATEVAATAAHTPGLGAIRPDPQIDVPQIRIRPNRMELARYGVSPADVADDVVAWRQGQTWTQILGRDGRVVNVAITGPPTMRDRSALGDLPIDTPDSGAVNLATLAGIDEVPAPVLINHDNGERRIAVGIDVPGGGLSSAVSELERRLQAIRLPQGYRIDVSGEALARRQAARQLLFVGAIVLLGVFMLLAVAFTSIRDATVTLVNFPLGLIGGVVGALLTPEGLSVAGLVGFVTLFGIISRNGIMLVAHKQRLDAEHPDEDPIARILRASEERLLPILMTAGAAGFGLLPLALSFESAGSELEAPMALIVVLGLITSTALNMLVIPTIYVWLDRRGRNGRDVTLRGASA
jgi:CzcA family heavy metal efflux pump